MSNIFSGLFDMRSKEEKQKQYEAYSKLIFPYGEAQRDKVQALLADMFPKQRLKYLMMHYILIKENMIGEKGLSREEAFKIVNKKKMIKVTPELEEGIKKLLAVDLAIDENLQYPLAADLLGETL